MARVKTRYVGVYYRFGKDRVGPGGKQDRCYDIHYKAHGRYIWEKVGWSSEGYKLQDAIELRGQRVKALRHPELCTETPQSSTRAEVTLKEVWKFYQDNWLPNIKNANDLSSVYETYLAPYFSKKPIQAITPLDVEAFKHFLLNKKKANKENLKPSTVKKILSDLRRIINKAYSFGLLKENKNPISNIRIANSDSRRERYLTAREVEKLLDALQFTSCTAYGVAILSIYTGMRLGEILSITSQDVDIDSGLIYINGKTGRRCAYIAEEIKSQIKSMLPADMSSRVFLSPKKRPINPRKFSTNFTQIVNDIGFNNGVTDSSQRVVFHTLRHTFCSWLAIKGVPLYTIGELVGHSTVQMTKRYAKLSPDSKRDALRYINTTLLG